MDYFNKVILFIISILTDFYKKYKTEFLILSIIVTMLTIFLIYRGHPIDDLQIYIFTLGHSKEFLFIIALTGSVITSKYLFYYYKYPEVIIMSSRYATEFINLLMTKESKEKQEKAIFNLKKLIYALRVKDTLKYSEITNYYCPPHVFREWMLENAPKNIFKDEIGRYYYAVPEKLYEEFKKKEKMGEYVKVKKEIDPTGYGAYAISIEEAINNLEIQKKIIKIAKKLIYEDNQDLKWGRSMCLIQATVGLIITIISVAQIIIIY